MNTVQGRGLIAWHCCVACLTQHAAALHTSIRSARRQGLHWHALRSHFEKVMLGKPCRDGFPMG